ncbi:hypothetical protein, partial [Falsiroseomonas oryzae]
RWIERGGPRLDGPPQRQGFGARVLQGTVRAQLRGEVRLRWEEAGLTCEIDVPLQARAAA